MLSRRSLLAAALAPARPNIIVLLADDLGYADLSCYGNPHVRTPHLDALAARGVRYANFYSASAVCTPSRAALMTGRYPLRFDIRKAFSDDETHLPPTRTLANLLRDAGYSTGHVGKWHLGGLHLKHAADRAHAIPGPREHGFQHYLCQNEEQPLRRELGAKRRLYRDGGTCLLRDDARVTPDDPYYKKHLTDIVGDESVRLLRQFHAAKQPFFLNVWFLDPHAPYEPATEPFWSQAAADGITHDQRCARSMVAHMDHQCGRILATLDELGLRENTLVFFSSDNGGAYEANIGPYRGGKTDLHEGGIRVPGILSLPGRVPAGVVEERLGHHTDLLPTVCAAAGVKPPAGLDGVNLLAKAPRDRTVFWQIDHYPHLQRHYPKPQPHATEALRRGRWKLLSRDGAPVALYDLGQDPLEAKNLLGQRTAVEAELAAASRTILQQPRDRRGAAPAR